MPDVEGYTNTGLRNVNAQLNLPYGSLSCSLNNLANNAQQCSNTSYSLTYHPENSPSGHLMAPLDVAVLVKIKTGTVSGGSPVVNVYLAGSNDGGITWSDGVAGLGLNGLVTLTGTYPLMNVQLLTQIQTSASNHVYDSDQFSIGKQFGGVLPSAWCLIIENKTGGALDASAGGSITYQSSVGVYF